MKIQFVILLFLVCINLSVTMAVTLGFPATGYSTPFQGGGNTTEYQTRFNSTKIASDWQAKPFSGVPILGDIFSGFYFLFNNWEFLTSGLSYVFRWIGDSYLTDAAMSTAFNAIANVILAVYAILMATFMLYLITGREL